MNDTGSLILPSTGLPDKLKAKENLTLDQIDARNVKVNIAPRKKYAVPRVRITNQDLTLMVSPDHNLVVVKHLLGLAVEARRQLRHPNNQPHATPFKGVAWGRLDSEKPFPMIVTIGGDQVAVVYPKEEEQKDAADETTLIKG